MIVTDVPQFDEDLKKITPWWDVVSQYLIAAMMAIALTSIAIQFTGKDNLICIPAIDCSHVTGQNNHTKLPAVNVSQDTAKICQSLTTKSLKKKVLAKMVDRRFYDYVDSVCYQDLRWFTKFFPLIIFGETVLLVVFHLLWTKLPISSSILNHFVVLANESYSAFGTLDIILNIKLTEGDESKDRSDAKSKTPPHASPSGSCGDRSEENIPLTEVAENDGGSNMVSEAHALNNSNNSSNASNDQATRQTDPSAGTHGHLNRRPPLVSEADCLKVQTLVEKADKFRSKYNKKYCYLCSPLFCLYFTRVVLQILICLASVGTNLYFFILSPNTSFTESVRFECSLDEFVFTKEYDHFECSYPLAPYFMTSSILFLIPLCLHLSISFIASIIILVFGRSFVFKGGRGKGITEPGSNFSFLFYFLNQHDELYADRVIYFYRSDNISEVPQKIEKLYKYSSTSY